MYQLIQRSLFGGRATLLLLLLLVTTSQASVPLNNTVWQAAMSGVLLRSVFIMSEGRKAWAVGDSGAIVATVDGGLHWTPQDSSAASSLWSTCFAADGRRGWAVGEKGT